MAKLKYWYIRFKNKEKPDIIYRGIIGEYKCERSAMYWTRYNYGYNEEQFECIKCVEISESIYKRLLHLEKLRKYKEYDEWKKSGKLQQAWFSLLYMNSLLANSPYNQLEDPFKILNNKRR